MPNYKLSPSIVQHMIAEGNKLLERRVSHMNTGFPIGYKKLQAAILPGRWRDTILEMKADGISAIHDATILRVSVVAYGIERAADVYVITKKKMLFCHDSHSVQLDLQVLSSVELSSLISWVNTAVRERRLANLAKKTIAEFFDGRSGGTSGHIVARWPALTTLVDPKTGWSEHQRMINAGWRTKFASPPRNLNPYLWGVTPSGWQVKNEKAMKLTEMLLNSASLLPEKVEDSAEVEASIYSWTPAPGDLDKP